MRSMRAFLTLGIALALGLGMVLAVGFFVSSGRAAPPIRSLLMPGNPVPDPPSNTHTAPPTTAVSITYDEVISPATVSTRTFAVFASQTGLLMQTYGVNGGTIVLTPTRPFKPGELVRASATTGTLNLSGEGPISPTVWQFRAAVIKGTGVFSDSFQTLGNAASRAVVLGDVDGDGDLDALVGNDSSASKLWLNEGGVQGGTPGIFSDSLQTLGVSRTMAVALGDLDGDGDLDAFVGNGNPAYGDQANRVWLNDGGVQGGTLGLFTDSGQTLGITTTGAIALGDLDGDGDLDAFVGNSAGFDYGCTPDPCPIGGVNQVWLNDASGAFMDSGQRLDAGSDTQAVALGDVDGDGDLDALVGNDARQWASGNWGGGENRVWLNDGMGVFTGSSQTLGATTAFAVALGDLDSDGDLDAFIGNNGYANMVWLNAGGVFTDSGQLLGSSYTYDVALGDLDGDGDLDAFAGNDGANRVWLNDGTGVFTDGHPSLGSERTQSVALGDVDGDGDLDAFLGNAGEPGPNTVWLNNKNAPWANDDHLAVPVNSSANALHVLANDVDFNADVLTIIAVGTPSNGSASTDGIVAIYTPTLGFTGADAFDYTISDVGGLTDTATVIVTVSSTNNPPVAQDDVVTTNEDKPVKINVLGNDSDPDGQIPFVLAVGTPISGSAVIVNNKVNYTPAPDLSGVDVFTYTISDAWLGDTATITVTVNPVNDPPTVDTIPDMVIDEDAPTQTVHLSGITSGAFNEAQALTVTVQRAEVPPYAIPIPTVFYTSPETTGRLVFQPAADEWGVAFLNVVISDGLATTECMFQVTVSSINDPPTLNTISNLVIDEDVAEQTINLWGISYGPTNENEQRTSLAVTAASTDTAVIPHPTVSYTNAAGSYTNGSLAFTPNPDRFGQATIIVTVTDGISETGRAIPITVNPLNDAPTLDAISDLVIHENIGEQTVNLTGISAGPYETDPLAVAAASTHTGLIPHPVVSYVSPNTTGSLRFTPVDDQVGQAALVVTVTDGLSETHRSFLVTVTQLSPLVVIATSPPGNGAVIARNEVISATLNRAVDGSTVSTRTFTVRGKQTGVYEGTYAFAPPQFDAASAFKSGEEIVVNLSHDLQGIFRKPLTPYVWQFRAAVGGGTGVFVDSGQSPGDYGGLPPVLRRVIQWGHLAPQSVLDTQAVALGDVDGDGDLDAYVVKNGAPATVWVNDGMGVYSSSGQDLGSANSWAVALGDLDGDGDLDAFVGNYHQGDTVWMNNGAGTFVDSGQILGAWDTYAVALGDLDGDGDLDAVTGTDIGQPNRVWLNDGGIQEGAPGMFTDSGRSVGFRDTRAVVLGDLDGDGDLDVFGGNSGGRANEVWLNDGTGRFNDSGQRLGSSDTYAVALGDVDGDGDLDAFVGNMNGEADEVWLNDGGIQGGTPGAFTDSGHRLDSSATWAVALGDVDADGDLDAVAGNVSFGDNVGQPNRVWLNDGVGGFDQSGQTLGDWDTLAVALGDVDGDGDLDAFLGNSNGLYQSNRLYLNQPNVVRALDDSFAVPMNTPIALDVLSNDDDPDGDALVVAAVGTPVNGDVSTDGSAVVYTPHPDFTGSDVFTYTVSDPGGLTDVAVVYVTVFEGKRIYLPLILNAWQPMGLGPTLSPLGRGSKRLFRLPRFGARV